VSPDGDSLSFLVDCTDSLLRSKSLEGVLMVAVSDNLIIEKVRKNKERGIKLGLFTEKDNPDIESLLDLDIIWNVLNVSYKMEVSDLGEEAIHRMMLQYANLNKVRAINRQTRNKIEDRHATESMFDKIVKGMIVKEKSAVEDVEKKKEVIVKKVITGKTLTESEQDILDAAAECGME
jgi:hypothetical protein